MKPDQHKRKRSAQYKKKHGIQNEKTSKSSKGKGSEHQDGNAAAPATTATCASASATSPTNLNDERANLNGVNGPTQNLDITPSFSRRKIESNWDRYEGLPDDDEAETVTSRGVEFNRLLSETGHAEAQFRFKDEQSWEEDETLASEAGSKLLSVDVDALTKHVKAIPLPERLGILRCFFEDDLLKKFDREAEENSTSVKYVHSLTTTASSSVHSSSAIISNRNDATLELSINETSQKEHQTTDDLKESLKSSLPTSSAVNTSQVKGDVGKCDPTLEGARTSSNLEDTPENTQALSDDKGGTDEDADDELDFLLSLENPVQVKGQSDVTSDAAEVAIKADSCDDAENTTTGIAEESPKSMVLPATGHQSTTAVHDGTDDLEDWLDDMLDD